MGREIKRVPLDFNWPLNSQWIGYLNPYRSFDCKECDGSGYNQATKQLSDDWYDFDNTGRKWCYNITQDEVNALVKEHRLIDFTHNFMQDKGWVKKIPEYVPTAEEVNKWAKSAPMGHDALNRGICIRTRAKRLGVYGLCEHCKGEGIIYFSEKLQQLEENWYNDERYDPPQGKGYQLWETVSVGSPVSPVFETPEELASWLVKNDNSVTRDCVYEEWLNFIKKEMSSISMVCNNGKMMSGVKAIDKD